MAEAASGCGQYVANEYCILIAMTIHIHHSRQAVGSRHSRPVRFAPPLALPVAVLVSEHTIIIMPPPPHRPSSKSPRCFRLASASVSV